MTEHAALDAWACRYPDTLAIRQWPEGSVVYDATDSSLHALTPVAAELLGLLLDGRPRDCHTLARDLLQEAPQDEDVALVRQQLQHFEHLGLIERILAQ